MGIRLTEETLAKIDKEKWERLKLYHMDGMGIEIINSSLEKGACVYICGAHICRLEEIGAVAKEMQLMVDILKDVTGMEVQ